MEIIEELKKEKGLDTLEEELKSERYNMQKQIEYLK